MSSLQQLTRSPATLPQEKVDSDILERLRDQGVVSIDHPFRQALSEIDTRVIIPIDRWAVFFGDFVIIAAYEF